MNGILLNAVRSGIQYIYGSVLGWLAAVGIQLSDEESMAVQTALGAIVMGLTVAGLRWLETRTGDDPSQVWSRKVAGWLMLGMSGAQPTYTEGKTTAKR